MQMNSTRETLLDPALEVPASDVRWFFMRDFYDGPISGLVIFRSRIVRCCCFQEDVGEQKVYVLQELSAAELAEERRIKAKFERMVGTHGCFDEAGMLMPKSIGDESSRAQFFEEEKHDSSLSPYDRPIIAWFDISKK